MGWIRSWFIRSRLRTQKISKAKKLVKFAKAEINIHPTVEIISYGVLQ